MCVGPLFWFSRSTYWSVLRWFPKLLQQQISHSTFCIAHMVAIALFRSWCFSTFSFFLRQHWSHLVLPHHYFFILSPYLLQPRYPVFSPLLHYIVALLVARENSRHLAMQPLVSPPNDVWETSAEIPYWWRVTTQIWVVHLIGRAAWEIWFNHEVSPGPNPHHKRKQFLSTWSHCVWYEVPKFRGFLAFQYIRDRSFFIR